MATRIHSIPVSEVIKLSESLWNMRKVAIVGSLAM